MTEQQPNTNHHSHSPINSAELDTVECHLTLDEHLITAAYKLMAAEFQSKDGNLRDKTPQELDELISTRGQLWVAHQDRQVIATHTLEAIPGQSGLWMYLNNGVVAPQFRRRSSGIMDQLLAASMENQELSQNFFVISVVWGIFERAGFRQVSVEELTTVDPVIAQVVANKLRPGKAVFIGIRQGGPQ